MKGTLAETNKKVLFLGVLRLMEEFIHQLRLVVYPIIYDGFNTIPGGCLGFLPSTVFS